MRVDELKSATSHTWTHHLCLVGTAVALVIAVACGGGGGASSTPTTPTPQPAPTPAPSDLTIINDIPYATIAGVTLRLDIVKPANGAPARMPLVIYVHGGGFLSGDKSGGIAELQTLARRGYVGATIDYRLGAQFRFPAQVQDVKAAVRFLRTNAAQYSIDDARIGLWGVSSGGTLAALAGVGNDIPEWDPTGGSAVSTRVKAVATWFGTYDLLDSCASARADVTVFLGCAPSSCVTAAQTASARSYVSSDDPAFFVMPGACPAQGQQFHNALLAAGAPSVLNLEGFEGNVPASALAATQAFWDSSLTTSSRSIR